MTAAPDAPSRSALLSRDLVAGATVALILIPQSLAYAELAGVPPVRGLYAAALPPVLAAFFASSPWLQTGPGALTALLSFGALAANAVPGSDEYIAQAALLALIVGVVRIGIGVLRAGAVTFLMSLSVLRGFTLGAAILIASSQLPGLLGVLPESSDLFGRALESLAAPGRWDFEALGFAGLTVALLAGGRLVHPVFPGLLLAVAASVVISSSTGYSGVRVGPIPSGFPELSLALPWRELPNLLLPGAVIALVGFAEAASISQTFAERERRPWDPNQEFVSQGAANLGSAISGGFPVGGSFARSSINHLAGAQSRWSGGFTGLAVLAALPFAGVLSPLPKAVLAMTILVAVRPLLSPTPLIEIWRVSRVQASIAGTTLLLTLVFAPRVEFAIVAGILLSVAVHLWREGGQQVDVRVADGELVLRPIGVMWFGSSAGFRRSIAERLAANPALRRVVVDLSGLGRLDLSGAYVIRDSLDAARESGMQVAIAHVPPQLTRIVGKVCAGVEIVTPESETMRQRTSRRSLKPTSMEEQMATYQELVAAAKAQVATCGAEEAAKRIRERANLLLLDVREPNEHSMGIAPGAELVPRGLLESKIGGLCASKDQEILIYCAGGNRAALAAKTLGEMGYSDVTCIDCAFMELMKAVS